MNNLIKVKTFLTQFLKEKGFDRIQIFNVPDCMGDSKELVFKTDEITILYAPIWEYIEIFGLTESEFNEISLLFGC